MNASMLIDAHYSKVDSIVAMFVKYIDETPIIYEYIQNVVINIPNLGEIIKQVSQSYGHTTLPIGKTPEEEVSCVYQYLKYISDHPSIKVYSLGWGYARSNSYQDMVSEFGKQIVLPFVNQINMYLSDIATDMGYDEGESFLIQINGGQAQVNVSNDDSTINANQINNNEQSRIDDLISEFKKNVEKELSENETTRNVLLSQIELIQSESKEKKPKKTVLKAALGTIDTVLKTVPKAIATIDSLKQLFELLSPMIN